MPRSTRAGSAKRRTTAKQRTTHIDRFAWLVGTNDLPPTASLSTEDLDAVFAVIRNNWQAIPVMAPRFLEWVGNQHQENPQLEKIRDLTLAVRALARIEAMLCHRFAQGLENSRVPYVLLKGSATRLLAYAEPDLRGGLDIDVGVPKRYIKRAELIAREQGFVPASFDASQQHVFRVTSEERAPVEAKHYQLVGFTRRQLVQGLSPDDEAAIRRSIPLPRPWHIMDDDRIACYVTLDIHHALSLDIPVEPLVEARLRQVRHGYSAWIPQAEWLALHLIFKIYWEGVFKYRRGVYQYADLIRLLEQIKGSTASKLFDLLEMYHLEAGAYYVLRRLETDFGLALSPELCSFLAKAAIPPNRSSPEKVNDMGDVWPKLWGFR